MEEKRTDAPFRAKICIGHCEVLSTWAATCPKCNKHFRLLWPFWVCRLPFIELLICDAQPAATHSHWSPCR